MWLSSYKYHMFHEAQEGISPKAVGCILHSILVKEHGHPKCGQRRVIKNIKDLSLVQEVDEGKEKF